MMRFLLGFPPFYRIFAGFKTAFTNGFIDFPVIGLLKDRDLDLNLEKRDFFYAAQVAFLSIYGYPVNVSFMTTLETFFTDTSPGTGRVSSFNIRVIYLYRAQCGSCHAA